MELKINARVNATCIEVLVKFAMELPIDKAKCSYAMRNYCLECVT